MYKKVMLKLSGVTMPLAAEPIFGTMAKSLQQDYTLHKALMVK